MAKKALDLGVSLKDSIDNFATDCGWNSSVKNVLIKGLEAIGVGAAIGAATAVATEAGLVAGLTAGAGIFLAGEATAKATDLSAEAAVTYAISQANTEEEAQSYADLVMSMVEWGVIGLSAVGAYKGVKGKVPALRNIFSKAKVSELFRLSRAEKKAATASTSGTIVTKNVKKHNQEFKSMSAESSQIEDFILTPYKEGKGHHIHMKSGYKSHPLYDLNEALCLSNEQMAKLGIKHNLVSIAQRKKCAELIRSGKNMTREEMNRISVESLVAGGASEQLARNIVAKSQWDLKGKGVRMPTDMPWGKNEKR